MEFSRKHPRGGIVRVLSKLTPLNQKAMKVLRAVRILSRRPLRMFVCFYPFSVTKEMGGNKCFLIPLALFHGV